MIARFVLDQATLSYLKKNNLCSFTSKVIATRAIQKNSSTNRGIVYVVTEKYIPRCAMTAGEEVAKKSM